MLIDFVRSRTAISVVALASLWLLGWPEGRGVPTSSAEEAKSSPPIWTVPEIGALPNDANSGLVRRGAIRRTGRPPLAFFERPEWMRDWFGDDAVALIERCRRLNALLEPDGSASLPGPV